MTDPACAKPTSPTAGGVFELARKCWEFAKEKPTHTVEHHLLELCGDILEDVAVCVLDSGRLSDILMEVVVDYMESRAHVVDKDPTLISDHVPNIWEDDGECQELLPPAS